MDNKEEKKVEVKEAKPKKEKKPKLDFNKIDVTTATDDDIIRSGIRNNTTSDKICYFLIAVVCILAILPPALRIINPKPVTEVEREIVYLDLNCFRTMPVQGGTLHTEVVINYRDGESQLATINFTYSRAVSENGEVNNDTLNFVEINDLEKASSQKGVTKEPTEKDKYSYVVDFEHNPELLSVAELTKYSYVSGVEIDYLKNKDFYCSSKSEVKKELVDVKTGKRVE